MTAVRKLKEDYEGEWLAIAVLREGESGPEEGELVFHCRNREDLWQGIKGDERKIYVTYAGPALEEGYAAAF